MFSLQARLICALVPPRVIGSYMLYRDGDPAYVGRSDTDLRRRLLAHAARGRCTAFSFNVHGTVAQAFTAECGDFHALRGATRNQIHPATPRGLPLRCPFCAGAVARARAAQVAAHGNG